MRTIRPILLLVISLMLTFAGEVRGAEQSPNTNLITPVPNNITIGEGGSKPLAVYEYCNLHGLWKVEL